MPMEYVKFSDIQPAEYNPRQLSDEAFEQLQGSLKTLGFILPIIVNKDNMTIVAGHQRTRAAGAVGIEEAPCFFVHDVKIQDEMRFNLIHNGVEYEPEVLGKCLDDTLEEGKFYTDVANNKFDVATSRQAAIVKDMCRLILSYGDALCAIICGGEIVFGNNYVYACQRLHKPVHCYILEAGKRKVFDYYFKQDYGVFCYDNLERPEFVQGLAQPARGVAMEWSMLYRHAVKWILEEPKDTKILDFGCGKARFIDKLRIEYNYKNAIGLEFFNHNRTGISVEKGNKMIDAFFNYIRKKGKFQYVMCEAVINSVTCQEGEDGVMACLNLFCELGGTVFFCGRMRDSVVKKLDAKRDTVDDCASVMFLDKNGLTAVISEGQWFFQKYLTEEQLTALPERFGLEPFTSYRQSGYFGFGCKKVRELDRDTYIRALKYEFNMRIPGGKRYGRQNEALELFGYADAIDTAEETLEQGTPTVKISDDGQIISKARKV